MRKPLRVAHLPLLLALAPLGVTAQEHGDHHSHGHKADSFHIPSTIIEEHEDLHAELAKAISAGGETGKAAQRVEEALAAHFQKEEQYALPPLALLVPLAEGKSSREMAEIAAMGERLERELPAMLREHEAIVQALEGLAEAARRENNSQAERFAHHLMHHARNEEEILYPAAILVGKYLKLKSRR